MLLISTWPSVPRTSSNSVKESSSISNWSVARNKCVFGRQL
eukprot:SAG22_NODE_101_length_20519_cov_15.588002_24_plen_41_part_00